MGRGASMKVKRKDGPPLGPWDIAACVMAGLLYLDVLCFLILTVAGIGLLLVYALECGIVTGVLLLLGMFLYFLGKSRGMGKLSRRLLLGGLIAGGVLLLLYALAVGALIDVYKRQIKGRDPSWQTRLRRLCWPIPAAWIPLSSSPG